MNDMQMAWNEPENNRNNSNDPWGAKNQGPPDLDEFLKKLKHKVFGGSGGGSSSSSGGNSAKAQALIFICVFLLVYIGFGFYIIHPPERAAITRFGAFNRIEEPGLHWLPPLIEAKQVANVLKVSATGHKATMLTKDENMVDVEVAVQYRISNVEDYFFSVLNPVKSLQEATESALRQSIGHADLDFIITTGRAQIADEITQTMTRILNVYKAGLEVVDVAMQPAKYPGVVKSAFDDVIKAQEERVSTMNKAEAYANKILPVAEGRVQRILEEAEAYKQETIEKAKGDTARFALILPQYRKAPTITKKRLYIEAMQNVLANSTKVVVGLDSGNNLIYLPIDKLIKQDGDSSIKRQFNESAYEATNLANDKIRKIRSIERSNRREKDK